MLRRRLPALLAAVPPAAWLLARLATLSAFDWLRPVTDLLVLICFLVPVLVYDFLGLVRFNVLGARTPHLGAELLYVVTSSALFFALGLLLRRSKPQGR